MWPCYGVHIHITCGTPCLCTLSASESSLHQLDFFLEIFLWTLVSDMRLSVSLSLHNLLLICFCYLVSSCNAAHTLVVDVSSQHMYRRMASNSQALPPQSSPQKALIHGKSYIRSKTKLKWTFPKEFSDCQWLFRTPTHITSWCLAERKRRRRRKKMNNSEFQPLQVCHTKIGAKHHYISTADWGRLYISYSCTFRCQHCFPAIISPCKH